MSEDLRRNHFELFDLPVGFSIDLDVLSRRYRELQRTVHPDRYASASDQERRLSVQRAAQINEAYRCLKDPLSRARYLLELQGLAVDDENNKAMDPEFLMEQMELREALEEAQAKDNPLIAVSRFIGMIGDRIARLKRELAVQFEQGDLPAARQIILKLQFFDRLRDEAMNAEAALEDALT
jgi:molecular chaperone HscB